MSAAVVAATPALALDSVGVKVRRVVGYQEEQSQTQGRAVPAPLAQKRRRGIRTAARAVKQVVGEEPFLLSPCHGSSPTPPPPGEARPLLRLWPRSCWRSRNALSFERRSSPFSMDQHH